MLRTCTHVRACVFASMFMRARTRARAFQRGNMRVWEGARTKSQPVEYRPTQLSDLPWG